MRFELSDDATATDLWDLQTARRHWRELPCVLQIMSVVLLVSCCLPIAIIFTFWYLLWHLPQKAMRKRSAMERGLRSSSDGGRAACTSTVVPHREPDFQLVITGTDVLSRPIVERRRTPSLASSHGSLRDWSRSTPWSPHMTGRPASIAESSEDEPPVVPPKDSTEPLLPASAINSMQPDRAAHQHAPPDNA